MDPQGKFADVNGVKLHYLVAGKGDPVLLLHGFAETSHMWLPLIAKLADKHTVIAPDLRGLGMARVSSFPVCPASRRAGLPGPEGPRGPVVGGCRWPGRGRVES